MANANENLITVASNSETLKERKLSFKDWSFDIVVKADDILNGNEPILYGYRYGMIYNPKNQFKPEGEHVKGNHAIDEKMIEEYFSLKKEAEKNVAEIIEKMEGKTSGAAESIANLQESLHAVRTNLNIKEAKIRELTQALEAAKQAPQNNSLEQLVKKNIEALELSKPKHFIIEINGKKEEVKSEVVHPEFETVLNYIAEDEPVYMHGNAGTGKSHIAKQVADALKLPFYSTQALSNVFDLTGFMDANGRFQERAFYKAFKNGGLFMIDEIDASHPEVATALNTAIAQGYFEFPNGEIVTADENFRCIAAGNTVGKGATDMFNGRYQLDGATLDRFFLVHIDYFYDIELHCAKGSAELVEFAHKVRQAADETEIGIIFSYRSITRIAKLEGKIELPKLINQALIKGLASDDVRQLARNMSIDSNNKYFKAFKKAA